MQTHRNGREWQANLQRQELCVFIARRVGPCLVLLLSLLCRLLFHLTDDGTRSGPGLPASVMIKSLELCPPQCESLPAPFQCFRVQFSSHSTHSACLNCLRVPMMLLEDSRCFQHSRKQRSRSLFLTNRTFLIKEKIKELMRVHRYDTCFKLYLPRYLRRHS